MQSRDVMGITLSSSEFPIVNLLGGQLCNVVHVEHSFQGARPIALCVLHSHPMEFLNLKPRQMDLRLSRPPLILRPRL